MLTNFKGSSVEKFLRLLAGSHHVKVQFIPQEVLPSLKAIERSEKFIMQPKGYALIFCSDCIHTYLI